MNVTKAKMVIVIKWRVRFHWDYSRVSDLFKDLSPPVPVTMLKL